MISNLPVKASRTLVELRGLPSDSTCVFEAEPGGLDIKRREPGYQLTSWFTLQTSDYDVIIAFRVYSTSLKTSFIQKVQRHDDLIKAHAV